VTPKGQGRDFVIFEAAIKLFNFLSLTNTAHSVNLYGNAMLAIEMHLTDSVFV